MNRADARRIARNLSAELREFEHERLLAVYGDRPRCRVVFGRSGVAYQVEVRAEGVEDCRGRNLRVTVTVDDGDDDPAGPVSERFVVRSGESLVTSCGAR